MQGRLLVLTVKDSILVGTSTVRESYVCKFYLFRAKIIEKYQ